METPVSLFITAVSKVSLLATLDASQLIETKVASDMVALHWKKYFSRVFRVQAYLQAPKPGASAAVASSLPKPPSD